MTIKRLFIVSSSAALLAVTSFAYAQGGSAGGRSSDSSSTQPGQTTKTWEKSTSEKAQNLRTLTVTVKDVDTKNHKVTFESQVSPEANIMESGKPIALEQLKEGDQVRASFDPQSNELVRVQVIRSESSSSSNKSKSQQQRQ